MVHPTDMPLYAGSVSHIMGWLSGRSFSSWLTGQNTEDVTFSSDSFSDAVTATTGTQHVS